MNNIRIKVQEDENEYIEISEDNAEKLLCKNIINATDFTQFIFNNFNFDWLKKDQYKIIYKIAKIYWEKYENIPDKSVFLNLFENRKNSSESVELIKSFNELNNFDDSKFEEKFKKKILVDFIKDKAIYFAIYENYSRLHEDGIISCLMEKFEKIIQMDLSEDIGIDYFKNFENHCKDLVKKESKTSFGFDQLDRYTNGGLPSHDTCLFIIMAQPGLGKSQFMTNIAYQWILQNKKVLILSLEMSEDMYSRRFDALFSDLNINKLGDNLLSLKNKVSTTRRTIPDSILRIKEFPTGTLTSLMIKQYLKKLKSTVNFVPDILFVDYLNIMRPNNYGSNTSLYEKCAHISEELRAISSELKIPVVSAVQANRNNNGGGYAGENIDMGNVSESSGITATADALVALYQLEGERELGRINMKILKNRLGGYVGTIIPFHVDYENSLKMSDWASETDVNDDILGDVTDISNSKYKNNVTTINNNKTSTIEDF